MHYQILYITFELSIRVKQFKHQQMTLHETAEKLYAKLLEVEKKFLVAIGNGNMEEANKLTEKATEIKKELDPLLEHLNQENLS